MGAPGFLDALYFGLGIDLPGLGYCGDPRCDPGPIPAVSGLVFLPPAAVLVAAGVALRKRAATGRRARAR